ncbi:MAG TPA: DUF1573 domain-containing protein [Bacteroidota bacterium]|nr:DUF1573 domain-containing protein [Bacteroidota bacterium]
MKTRYLCLFFGTLIATGVGVSQPKIEVVTGNTIDMGSVYGGEIVQKIAVIKNVGTDTLTISDVKAQCGCTATLMSEKVLAPNDTGKLSISFNTAGQNGHRSKQVYVMSNDPANPKLTITFSADVMSVLDIMPKVISFNNSKVDSSYTQTVTIKNPSQSEAVNILSVKVDVPSIKTTLMKNKLMPGEETQMQVTIAPTKSGTMNGKIAITTDHKKQSEFDIGVFAFISKK